MNETATVVKAGGKIAQPPHSYGILVVGFCLIAQEHAEPLTSFQTTFGMMGNQMTIATAVLLLVLQNQAAKASIEGFVVRAGTNEPISGSRITVSRTGAGIGMLAVTTDGQGHFIINDLDAGTYILAAQRNGFARQLYGERAVGRPGTPLKIASGQVVKDVVFRLIPAGAVTGRVSDVSGEPLPHVAVQLYQAAYQSDGRRTFVEVGAAQTNDRGEYRIFYVSPGRYFISARAGRVMPLLSGAVVQPSANEVIEPGYPLTYYPGATDPSAAASIEVQAGTDLGAVDFSLRQQNVFRVRGSILTSDGQFPNNAQVLLTPRNPLNGPMNFNPTAPSDYNNKDGTFQIRDVVPGSYWLQALSIGTAQAAVAAEAAVDVSEHDVEGVVLAFTSGYSISGHLFFEAGTAISQDDRIRLRISLAGTAGRPLMPNPFAPISEDGTFHMDNVQPGEYKLSIVSSPPGMYLKEVRFGQVDSMNGISIRGPVSGSLEVLLSPNAGQITGTIVDRDRNPVRNIEAVLIPNDRERHDLYRTATSDQNGLFSIPTIVPGDYKLFAWEDIEPYAYMDPDFLRRYEGMGSSVNVLESQKLSIEHKLIPAGQ